MLWICENLELTNCQKVRLNTFSAVCDFALCVKNLVDGLQFSDRWWSASSEWGEVLAQVAVFSLRRSSIGIGPMRSRP